MSQKRGVLPDGFKNGYLEYLGEAPDRISSNGYLTRWVRVRCVCGVEKEVLRTNFNGGNTRSCGCMSIKISAEKKALNLIERDRTERDLNFMRLSAIQSEEKKRKDILNKIKVAEERGDFLESMEWTLLFLERADKTSVLEKEEEEITVGNFVFEQ